MVRAPRPARPDALPAALRPMWISGTTQYALRAVVFVAEHATEGPVRVDAIARALQVPRNYLSKTLHALARAGVLRSERGPRGGFRLAIPPDQLSLARIAAPFDDLGERGCLLGRRACGWANPCAVHPRWEEVSTALQDFFRRTTIADLLGEITQRPAMAPLHDVPPERAAAGPRPRGRPRSRRSGAAGDRRRPR